MQTTANALQGFSKSGASVRLLLHMIVHKRLLVSIRVHAYDDHEQHSCQGVWRLVKGRQMPDATEEGVLNFISLTICIIYVLLAAIVSLTTGCCPMGATPP